MAKKPQTLPTVRTRRSIRLERRVRRRKNACLYSAIGALVVGGVAYGTSPWWFSEGIENTAIASQQIEAVKKFTPDVSTPKTSYLNGETIGIMWVPRMGANSARVIAQGATQEVFDDPRFGVGHYEETALPGELGNFAIAGHRTTKGASMLNLDLIEPGDPIYIFANNLWYKYRAYETLDVQPEQVEVIAPVPGKPGVTPTQSYITLQSCTPKGTADRRIIVHGIFESSSAETPEGYTITPPTTDETPS